MTDELAWDYTGDESSPLLQRAASPFYSGERNVINRRQARYILHNVHDISRILQSGLGREQHHDNIVMRNITAADDTAVGRFYAIYSRIANIFYSHCVPYIPVFLAISVVIALVVESVWDGVHSSSSQHRPYVAAVMCGLSAVMLVFIYLQLASEAVDYRVNLRTVVISFVASVVIFALIYVVCFRFDHSCFDSSLVAPSGQKIFIAQYLCMLQFSISVFTLSSTGHYEAGAWYIQLLLALQMLLAYCQFLLALAALLSHFHISSSLNRTSTGTDPAVRQTGRYDPDNESLGPPYNLHAIGNGNRDDGITTSGRHDDGCHGTTPPTQIPHSQAAADVLMTADDLYQSNSI